MLLDDLVPGLPADPGPHRAHQDLGGREERQVAVQLGLDHGREGAELVEHGQEGLQKAVEREERVRQRDPADHRAGDVALVPLVAAELGGHRGVPAQDDGQAVHALAGAGVHLVRHRGGADLALLEALGDELVAGHQADGLGQAGRRGGELDESGEHLEVQRPGVDLADAGQHVVEAEVAGDPLLQLGELVGVATEQVQHVLGGADRALDPAQRVPGDQLLQAAERHQQLVGHGREPLAEGGRLGGHVVRPAGHDQLGVLGGEPAQAHQHRHRTVADVLQGLADLELLDVLGEVPRGHALVDLLVAGKVAELLDPGLHVVSGDALTRGDGFEVDLVEDPLVVGDGGGGHLDTEVLLGLQDGEPQVALKDHLVLGGPQLGQGRRSVPGGQDIGDLGLRAHASQA